MENNRDEKIIFELILHAGNAKSMSMEAIYASRESEFDEAMKQLDGAQKELVEAHRCQSKLVFEEAKGENFRTGVLLSHALDHLVMATTACELAEEIILLRVEMKGGEK